MSNYYKFTEFGISYVTYDADITTGQPVAYTMADYLVDAPAPAGLVKGYVQSYKVSKHGNLEYSKTDTVFTYDHKTLEILVEWLNQMDPRWRYIIVSEREPVQAPEDPFLNWG